MSSDAIIGHDGKPRCAWAGTGDTALGRYHDEVWGTRTHDESALFEALTLGVFEVGLSWSIVFGKRDAFRKAFRGFDVAKVAAMTARDVERLVKDASIITPTQIVAGRNDDLVPWSNNEYLDDLLPNSEIHPLDAGHFAWEQAAEEYGRLVADWVTGGYRRVAAA